MSVAFTSDKFKDTFDLLLLQHLPQAVQENFRPFLRPAQILDMTGQGCASRNCGGMCEQGGGCFYDVTTDWLQQVTEVIAID